MGGPATGRLAEAGLQPTRAHAAGPRCGGAETRGHTPLPKVPALLARGAAVGRFVAVPRMSEAIGLYQSPTPHWPIKAIDLAYRFAIRWAEPIGTGINRERPRLLNGM